MLGESEGAAEGRELVGAWLGRMVGEPEGWEVGEWLGRCEGEEEGRRLGRWLGEADGREVTGEREGRCVGSWLGEADGRAVGFFEGWKEGGLVGRVVGELEGLSEGLDEGFLDGESEGTCVSPKCVGDTLGRADGREVVVGRCEGCCVGAGNFASVVPNSTDEGQSHVVTLMYRMQRSEPENTTLQPGSALHAASHCDTPVLTRPPEKARRLTGQLKYTPSYRLLRHCVTEHSKVPWFH
jgi:hypothetical protein